uniref:Uncharacterized protein n=1 Tax=Trichobilharzia regenti TaxID=157069 RepID=A0AA85KH18_TRIRE|nr:unnamed protein product [Trichobilharzia regenti]
MVSQRKKLYLILLISLFIVNIEEIESAEYDFDFTLDESGIITVNFGSFQLSLYDNFTVGATSNGCIWLVDLDRPKTKERENMGGIRECYLDCQSWHVYPFAKWRPDRIQGNKV